jgi:hypothetical protein
MSTLDEILNSIELLSVIAREAGELEELSAQAAGCVLPGPQRLDGTP